MNLHSETDTVVKRIIPYLSRRGYDIDNDIDFETKTKHPERYTNGYVDLLVTCGQAKPIFLIEAKRANKTLNDKDTKQALDYGKAQKAQFVIVTNGRDIRAFNAHTGQPIKWDGRLIEKIPTRDQLKIVQRTLKANPSATDISLGMDASLPYRPGLPLKQLNALFSRCHNVIRKIEKNEEHAFDDFSKLLFLKLLEEKADATPSFSVPYSYRFHELAEKPNSEADQVRDAVDKMIAAIKSKTPYGEVLGAPIHLKKAPTFHYIVKQLSAVSFQDSSLDSKGAAFEYFVRATLKGKKLGQYFTPRALVRLMSVLVGRKKIYNSLKSGETVKVLDPACGTGGFLVYHMQQCLRYAEADLRWSKITKKAYDSIVDKAMKKTFYGSDANDGVACAAKMNMIIAGDGHTNIQPEDSLAAEATNWNVENPDCDIILTNPPFGTSENDSLGKSDWEQYTLKLAKGQQLFLQKMVQSTVPDGDICTVIDDGILNTASARSLRKFIFQKCRVLAVARLPEETFKPNKINVRSSVLLLRRRVVDDVDLEDGYKVTFIDVETLGYLGSGDTIRNFDFEALLTEIESRALDQASGSLRVGSRWRAFDIDVQSITKGEAFRLDLKFWEPTTVKKIGDLAAQNAMTIASLNVIKTRRGKSPKAETYVDEKDGYALVVKAGTNITRFGKLSSEGDFIEKDIYDDLVTSRLKKGDVLIASTGTGTLGKACVFDLDIPAVADGHVTIIRPDASKVDPYYLADYLRGGAGALQIDRVYTGCKRRSQATALSAGAVTYAQGSKSSRRFWGWPSTMRVMTSAR